MEAILLTPKRATPSRLKQRRITPSPEKSITTNTTLISPKNRPSSALPITTTVPKNLVSSTKEAKIGRFFAQTLLATVFNSLKAEFDPPSASSTPFAGPPIELAKAIRISRHIVFDFSLVEDGQPRPPRTETERVLLSNLFPTQYSVGVYGFFLIVRVRKLPPKPWPLTVAGLPFYITTDEWEYPWVRGKFGRGPKVLKHLDARYKITKEIFNAAIRYFDTQTNVRIIAIRWSIGSWRIVVPDGINFDRLPMVLAGNPCGYVLKSKVLQPIEAAYRLKEPSSTIAQDYSTYIDLRPGVMLSTARFEGIGSVLAREELLTSSGVLVKDTEDNRYMTVASHGFPAGEEAVYHPNSNGVIIGDLEKRLDMTDIALVKLRHQFSYRNETFDSQAGTSVTLSSIRDPYQLNYLELLYMDNPFTGDEDVPPFNWVRQDWIWMGQGSVDSPPDGSCGSPVWDTNGELVLFFRFIISAGPESGLAIGVAANELEKFGFSLV
ncbi:MAG: hypothetical protein M1840_005772 [Geoglossum simile]|nr:MAG: hypothetical protein M1840_005772 [Geoglossum simile]